MKIIDILKKAEEAEKTIIVIREPTKTKYGYGIRFTGDPMLQIMKLNNEIGSYDDVVHVGKKKYAIDGEFKIPSTIINKFIYSIRKLQKIEI